MVFVPATSDPRADLLLSFVHDTLILRRYSGDLGKPPYVTCVCMDVCVCMCVPVSHGGR